MRGLSKKAVLRREANPTMLTPKEREIYEEAFRRGVKLPLPARFTDPKRMYRKMARPKQLPPDTPGWVDMIVAGGWEHQVRVVRTSQDPRRPYVRVPITEATPEELSEWYVWFIKCGRGFGKTWTGANWINEGARRATGEYMAILGRDAHDVRAFMVEGETGILKLARPGFEPNYEPSKRLITWPNGVKCQVFYAEEPESIRGPNNFRGWFDEPASYKDAALGIDDPSGKVTAMSNFFMTLRIGDPQVLGTGTPKPLKLVKDLQNYEGAIIVDGGTRENEANLSKKWLKQMERKYAGTRVGRQELEGEVLDDNPGALWSRAMVEQGRIHDEISFSDFTQIAVGIDPQAETNEASMTGIVVAGKRRSTEGVDHYYVFEDASINDSPNNWAKTALHMHKKYRGDTLVAERNNGGEMVEHTIRTVDPYAPVKTVWASRGKRTRAEPIASLYEQGRVHHVGSDFVALEDEMCTWEPGQPSPNRMDALVWALTELIGLTETDTDDNLYEEFWNSSDSEDVASNALTSLF